MRADYDLIAIGGGAAGLVTAAGAAGLGARVALVEHKRMGGECLWTGCVPSKALLACARAAADARAAGKYGISVADVQVDFARVMAHVRAAQTTIAPHDSPERFRSLGVDVIEARARFVGERTLEVAGRTITGRHIVIATGSRPAGPQIPGLSDVAYYTNENIFDITVLPESLIVLGGGPIGVELAHAFALLGSRVTIIESASRILSSEEADLAGIIQRRLVDDGVTLTFNARVDRVEKIGDRTRVHAGDATVEGTHLLVAVGRAAVLDTMDLAAGGIERRGMGLQLDARLRTSARNVWAAGDVTGAPRFTHVADYQARTVLRNALFPLSTKVNYDAVPRVTFTIPELASVGITEAEARRRHGERIGVWTREFGGLDRAIADGRTTGLLKIITGSNGQILGGHVVGQHAGGIIAEITLAMKERIPLARLAATLHAYPTYNEAVKYTADAFVRSRFTGRAKSIANWLVRRV